MTQQKGNDIEQLVEITLQEAYVGTSRTFNLQSTELCPRCLGRGKEKNKVCTLCTGQRTVPRSKRIQVKFPAGVDNGSKIRVAGEGQLGIDGGPHGDLFLVISVRLDSLFERKEDDLWTEIKVEKSIAQMGGEVTVPCPDGRKLLLSIPPGTPDSRVFRLAKQGMPHLRSEGNGDLYARMKVTSPTALKLMLCYAREDEELLKKLKAHLMSLSYKGAVEMWYDRYIDPGKEWEKEINQQLETAQIILLLVSANFIDSDYCYGKEMQRALERHMQGKARVIPVILRSVNWHDTPLAKLQVLPTDGKPIISRHWHNLDEALFDVVNGIRKVVEELETRPSFKGFGSTPSNFSHRVRQQGIKGIPNKITTIWSKRIVPLRDVLINEFFQKEVFGVASCVVSPDGRWIISGSRDSSLRIWDAFSGAEHLTMREIGKITRCAVSPDGSWVVSASEDKTLKVWNTRTGVAHLTLQGHVRSVNDCAVSPDGSWIVSASEDKTLKVWDAHTGMARLTLEGHTSSVTSCAVSPDGSWIVSASEDKTLKVWDTRSGAVRLTLHGHIHSVNDCAVSPDGSWIVSASGNKVGMFNSALKVWDAHTGALRLTLQGHIDRVNCCAVSPDGSWIISGSRDGRLKVWDAHTGVCLVTLELDNPLFGCVWCPNGEHVVVAGEWGLNYLQIEWK